MTFAYIFLLLVALVALAGCTFLIIVEAADTLGVKEDLCEWILKKIGREHLDDD